MALPTEPIIKKFFTNKIESTRDDWYSYLIHIARIFYSMDGEQYDRDKLLEKFTAMSGRAASAQRDAANFRDEFGAYGTYLGIYHLKQTGTSWQIVVSEAAKQFLCTENPNAAAFCRSQLSLFQYPNGAGAVISPHGSVTVQGNSKSDTMRELSHNIRLNPFRLICRIVVSLVETQNIPVHQVAIPYPVLFCMVNDDRINTQYDPALDTISTVFNEYRDAGDSVPMALDGLTNFKRNFHILEKTGLFIRDSRFGLQVSQVNPSAAYDCIKAISNIAFNFTAFEDEYGTPDEEAVKEIISGSAWGEYYDAANLPLETLATLGVEIDTPPLPHRSFSSCSDAVDTESLRQRWMSMENQPFIRSCLDFMKAHALFTDSAMEVLQSKEWCTYLFRHNSLKGILLRVDPNVSDDEQRKDPHGNSRYYADKYPIGDAEYFVSSEWRPDREDARTSFIDWIFSLMQKIKFSTGYQSAFARNRILFGAPGTGKSFTLNHEKDALLTDGGEYERVTFHPDYSYANFVGTYKPVPHKDSEGKDAITYSYVPGPFMRTYVKALQNSKTDTPKPFLLIIEEINRANVAAVFGDVFQLLDRGDNEVSEYPIQATEDIKKYLAKPDVLGGSPEDYAEIRIPDNMFIWATMNSADQGVFPMDTAFKRRWDFTYLGIDDCETGIIGKKVILGQGEYRRIVEWNELRKAINAELISYKVNEDKLMGPYFISKKNLPDGEMFDSAAFSRIFKNKVLMYLFDDAAKQKRPSLFTGCEEKSRTQYSKICEEFDTKGVSIFCEGIRNKFIDVPGDDAE